ncbi:cell division topological specificity factor MinE [Wohlfahrtiimonas chitiniclastica]|nr:cell division topological specificity factor MinE [Wohlfahrtiimonas chitiniclastica]MBS7816994.1 cell division topological specificity factor MinE [Wohlfahrtiimonas chitiniclastica]MBS7822802.1 cell division topological specificity factor MinE [Wohlfahrtiimonas chitiniclastica]MBS7830617.1 cell division topological specificity factor MinE [Wohlfahrtiimonas chitiniclastica]MBS7832555.1 cell division topological specificity factor MinE [Wohlfahrtiimonas chitiniclastica]OYQ77393.1 cell divisio
MFSALFKRRKKTASASIAKERLQIIVAHERNQNSPSQQPDFLKALQQDILEVVRKYMSIDGDQIKVAMDKEDGFDVLELNITLSEKEEEALEAQAADAEESSPQAEPSHETR